VLDILRQCQRHVHLVKNRNAILRRILSVYDSEGDRLDRVQTLYALSYIAALGKERLDMVYIIRESVKSQDRMEQKAAIVALDSFLYQNDMAYLHFEFLLDMIQRFQEDVSMTVQLMHLLRHMTRGPSVLMQVSARIYIGCVDGETDGVLRRDGYFLTCWT
jgi:hypothetical protein